jgi:hypothetical protein
VLTAKLMSSTDLGNANHRPTKVSAMMRIVTRAWSTTVMTAMSSSVLLYSTYMPDSALTRKNAMTPVTMAALASLRFRAGMVNPKRR